MRMNSSNKFLDYLDMQRLVTERGNYLGGEMGSFIDGWQYGEWVSEQNPEMRKHTIAFCLGLLLQLRCISFQDKIVSGILKRVQEYVSEEVPYGNPELR